jgi:hypothetical protein
MFMFNRLKNSHILGIILLMIITIIVFGQFLFQLTYYRDDWYYMYDGLLGGAKIFHEMFKSDRPFRGYFFEWYYSLLGIYPLLYHIGAYLWRLVGAWGVFWLVKLIWPESRREAFWGAVLFALYPGYLWWVSAIEYQPMIASVCLEIISIGLTVKSIRASSAKAKWIFMGAAILTGWVYISLVDYAIGMEAFRFLVVYLVVSNPGTSKVENIRKVFRAWIPSLIIPAGFLCWRIFLFQNERKATDVALQFSRVIDTSGLVGFWWVVRWFQSTINVVFLAWGAPLYSNFFSLRLREIILGFFIASLTILVGLLGSRLLQSKYVPGESNTGKPGIDAIWIGLLGVICGVFPIVAANRYVLFERFSHYALPACFAGVICVLGLISLVGNEKAKLFIVSLLIGCAALTHFAVGTQALNEEITIQDFWWQMAWRAPEIAPKTTLVIFYPNIGYGEDYEIALGPASFIYYPNYALHQNANSATVEYPLSAVSMTSDSIRQIQVGHFSIDREVRSHSFYIDYGNILVVTQPTDADCVHVLDPRWAAYSMYDSSDANLIGSQSNLNNLPDKGATTPKPPFFLFGSESVHNWCYYYEKADLARQQGKWEDIIKLAGQAQKQGMSPNDQIEWLPFLQAYAYLGDMQNIKDLSKRINTEPFYKKQACQILNTMGENGYALKPEMIDQINVLFCGG